MKRTILAILVCGFMVLGITGCGKTNSDKLEEYFLNNGYTCKNDGWQVCSKKDSNDDNVSYEISFVDTAIKYIANIGEDGMVNITLWANDDPVIYYKVNDNIGTIKMYDYTINDFTCDDNSIGNTIPENCRKYISILNKHKNNLEKILGDSKISLDYYKLDNRVVN